MKVQSSFKRFKYVFVIILAMSCVPHATHAQDWIKTGTGLGLEKPRVAVADFAPRADPAKKARRRPRQHGDDGNTQFGLTVVHLEQHLAELAPAH